MKKKPRFSICLNFFYLRIYQYLSQEGEKRLNFSFKVATDWINLDSEGNLLFFNSVLESDLFDYMDTLVSFC